MTALTSTAPPPPVAVAVAPVAEAAEAVVAAARAPAADDTIEVEVAEAPGLPPAWVGAKVVEAVEGGSFKVEVNGDAEWVEEYTSRRRGERVAVGSGRPRHRRRRRHRG